MKTLIEEDLNTMMEEEIAYLKHKKILLILTMILVTFIFQGLSFALHSMAKKNPSTMSKSLWTNFLSYCSCFSGGVFIAACLLDLHPEANEKIEEIIERYNFEIDFPITNLLFCIGFFLILTVEQCVLSFQENRLDRRHHETLEETRPQLTHDHQSSTNHHHHGLSGVSEEVHHHPDGHGDHHSHAAHSVLQYSMLRSIMLLLALSFHSVFEGIAIGLQDTSTDLFSIFTAVMIHKALMAFSLGLNMAQSKLSTRNFIVSSIVFNSASPLGVAIGILISGVPPSMFSDISNGVLQCVAGGTFLYITFFEVLPHELNAPGNRLKKIFFVVIGFAAICGVLCIGE